MQHDVPLEQQQPSSLRNNNNNSIEHTDVNVPTLASKFEELISALPPLPKHPRRPPAQLGRKAKRRAPPRADAVSKPPYIIKQTGQQQQDLYLDEAFCYNLVGHRIGVWTEIDPPASISPTIHNKSDDLHSEQKNKKGHYSFGRVVGQESIPPYRHLIEYEASTAAVYVDLRNEVWVALCSDHNDTAVVAIGGGGNGAPDAINIPSPAAVTVTAAQNNVTRKSEMGNNQQEERITKIQSPRALKYPSPGHHHVSPPLIFENDYFSVYNTTCGSIGYEIYALCPDMWRIEDIKVEAFARGKVTLNVKQQHVSDAAPENNNVDGGGEVYTVDLPTKISPESARALFTSTGQLYIRVDRQINKKVVALEAVGKSLPEFEGTIQ